MEERTFLETLLPFFVGNIVGSFVDGLVLFSGEMLTHHKLKVYEKALAFGACAEEFSAP